MELVTYLHLDLLKNAIATQYNTCLFPTKCLKGIPVGYPIGVPIGVSGLLYIVVFGQGKDFLSMYNISLINSEF